MDPDKTLLDGKYQICRILGEGGFGRVYLAADELVGSRAVAIKVLLEDDAEQQDNLIREMKVLSKLNSPSVVSFYHHFLHEGKHHLVMEYCAQGSLRARMTKEGPVDPLRAFTWGSELAGVLGFVHSRGIVHHDIKPDNILFTAEGAIKIGDFGVANQSLGTLLYMAPEMFRSETSHVRDPRVDIYALGITLLEIMIGRNPFQGVRPNEIFLSKLRGEFVSPTLPHAIREILLKATHPTPELRFQTMAEFKEAMEARSVPFRIDRDRIRAHEIAKHAERLLKLRRWHRAKAMIDQALDLSSDSVAAHIVAGQYNLRLLRVQQAKAHFQRAMELNPRVEVQKELGWINLELGDYPLAISMINDYLQRNPTDYEAHNLLLQCFYLTQRFDVAADLALLALDKNSCFFGNFFLCRLLLKENPSAVLRNYKAKFHDSPFIRYNYEVVSERPASWNDDRSLEEKLLFHDYRFGIPKKKEAVTNPLLIEVNGCSPRLLHDRIVTVGKSPTNTVVLDGPYVSRRHCVIINYPDDVWIRDLGSTCGTKVDAVPVSSKAFLLGVHEVTIADYRVRITSRAGMLL